MNYRFALSALAAGLAASLAAFPLTILAQQLTPAGIVELAAKKDSASHSGFFWIPNTHAIVYSQATDVQSGSWIYRLDVASGTRQRLLAGENPQPSPDGRSIAFLRLGQGSLGPRRVGSSGMQLWVADADGGNPRQLTRLNEGVCDFENFAWSTDSRQIAYVTCSFEAPHVAPPSSNAPTVVVAFPIKTTPARNYTIHAIDVSTGNDRVAVNHQGELGRDLVWLDSHTILYEPDNSKPARYERSYLTAIDLFTGHHRTVLSGYQWQTEYGAAVNAARTTIAFRADPAQRSWFPSRNEIGILQLRSGSIQLLPFTRNAVGAAMAWAPDGRWLLYSDGPSTSLQLIAINTTMHKMLTSGDGQNINPSFSSDGRYVAWIYNNGADTTWLRIARWNNGSISASRNVVMLTNPLAGIEAGAMRVVRWKSFDGTTIDGFLTLPVHRSGGHYPTVVIIHGGAIFRNSVDEPEWPGEIYFMEYLAQHGYAVFQPDYRESGSFGYDLVMQEYARAEPLKENHADISSGVETLVREGIADPHRLYLLGHSYGSVMASYIITHDARYRAAVSYEGFDFFYDWSTFNTFMAGPNISMEWSIGHSTPLTRPAAWAANSAVLNAANATTPTLFINAEHGGDMPSLPWLAGALQSKGVDSQYLLYLGEQHVVLQPANQIDLIGRIMKWITSH